MMNYQDSLEQFYGNITDMIIDMVSEPVARYISMNRLYTTC